MTIDKTRCLRAKLIITAFFALLTTRVSFAASPALPALSLRSGYQLMYNLEFEGAHQVFLSWQQQHPDDPLGPASDAAGLLFSELHRLGVLEAQFYTDDKAFDKREKLTPDPALKDRFNSALSLTQTIARARLAKDPQDKDGLLAVTLSAGLKADYAALVEKKNLASLGYTKDASTSAQKLLAAHPNCYDAYVATGIGKYIIGSMAAPIRWFLRMGGYPADKKGGIEELKLTAEKGTYLAPFARILLAIAYVREKDKPNALSMLASLRDEFPKNPLFAREIARLDTGN
jgi:hypothetical protein